MAESKAKEVEMEPALLHLCVVPTDTAKGKAVFVEATHELGKSLEPSQKF